MKDSKKTSQSNPKAENADEKIEVNEDGEIEEYYLGKDRDDERKKKAYVTFILLCVELYLKNTIIML